MNRTWVVACAVAEAVGMTAAAGAARFATTLTDRGVTHATAWGLMVVVAGGLVEGTALGWLQARALNNVLGPIGRRRWLAVTVLVAGLGWAAASAPAVMAGDEAGDQPPLLFVLLGAAALGVVMGAVLGAVQASTLRNRVRHPWRWVAGSTAGWTVAMPVIFLGATIVGASWPWWLVVSVGALTGLLAGSALGAVSGSFLNTLEGPAWRHRVVLGLLSSPLARTPAGVADGGLVALGVTGTRTGQVSASRWKPRGGTLTGWSCSPDIPNTRPGGTTWRPSRTSKSCWPATGRQPTPPCCVSATQTGKPPVRPTPPGSRRCVHRETHSSGWT